MNFCFRSARLSLRSYKSQIWTNHHFKSKSYLIPRSSSLDIHVIRSFSVTPLFHNETKLTLNASDVEVNAANTVTDTAPELVAGSAESLDAIETSSVDASELVLDSYASPFASDEIVNFTNLVEPSFSSLGLSHGWPSGWLQTLMEFFHIDVGLPWWQTIAVTTLCLRIVIAPIVVMAQKNMVRMNNHQPTIQKLQVEIQMAQMRNEPDKAHFSTTALNNYFMANNCHPVKAMFPIFGQALCFMSMFFGLRGMVEAPVESMNIGGLAWFTDLTLADPTYFLPLATCATVYLQIYLGADGMRTEMMPPIMKKVIWGMPILMIPVMIQFPTALNLYWLSNNFISLIQAAILRNKDVKDKLGFEEMIMWRPQDLPMTTFHEEVKAEMARLGKIHKEQATRQRESEERRREKELLRTKSLLLETKHEPKKKFNALEEEILKKTKQ